VNKELQARVLEGAEAITCRPADLIDDELEALKAELKAKAQAQGIALTQGGGEIDDVLTYALFPEIGLKFLENRGNPDAFEPVPTGDEVNAKASAAVNTVSGAAGEEVYTVTVSGQSYIVQVAEGGDISAVTPVAAQAPAAATPVASGAGEPVNAPLAGNIFKVRVSQGQQVQQGDVIVILEAMKMETEVRAAKAGTVASVSVKEGDSVAVGDQLISIA
jgi:oxaloacetate decarboxylase alpha subunit